MPTLPSPAPISCKAARRNHAFQEGLELLKPRYGVFILPEVVGKFGFGSIWIKFGTIRCQIGKVTHSLFPTPDPSKRLGCSRGQRSPTPAPTAHTKSKRRA